MANLYGAANHSSPASHDEPDDFSLLLHQIMLRSSCSASSTLMVQERKEADCIRPSWGSLGNQDCGLQSVVSGTERLPLPDVSTSGGMLWSSGSGVFAAPETFVQERRVNVSSSSVSVATVDSDLNEYDCESEGAEGVVDEAIPKPTTARNSSKRSRAAEVHNLSEKRRRSRINEKMKALQNLIPNSNKTDKASMLDEAIDYLKQLQLQFQLLTMRNGLSLYPMCLPGVVQPNQVSAVRIGHEGNKSLNMDFANALPVNSVTPGNFMFGPSDNYTSYKPTPMVNLPQLNDSASEHSQATESVINAYDQGVFQFSLPGFSNKGIHMEGMLPCPHSDHSDLNITRTKSLDDYKGTEAAGAFNSNKQASSLDEDSLDAGVLGRENAAGLFLSNQLECGKVPTSQGNGY